MSSPRHEAPIPRIDDLGVIDTPLQKEFVNLTRLASRALRVPICLVSVIREDEDRQYFVGHCGLAEPWRSARQTPLSHSFCQHVKQEDTPLVVDDARHHPLVKDNPAVRELGVVAYLGAPIHGPDKKVIGALCAIDQTPRRWSDEDIESMYDLARCVSDAFRLRAVEQTAGHLFQQMEAGRQRIGRYNALLDTLRTSVVASNVNATRIRARILEIGYAVLGITGGIGERADGDADPRHVMSSASHESRALTPREISELGNHGMVTEGGSVSCTETTMPGQPNCQNLRSGYRRSSIATSSTLAFAGLQNATGKSHESPGWSIEEQAMLSTLASLASPEREDDHVKATRRA